MWIEAIVCNKNPANERMYDFIITYHCVTYVYECWTLIAEYKMSCLVNSAADMPYPRSSFSIHWNERVATSTYEPIQLIEFVAFVVSTINKNVQMCIWAITHVVEVRRNRTHCRGVLIFNCCF